MRRSALGRLLQHRWGTVGLIMAAVFCVVALSPGVFTLWSPTTGDLTQPFLEPGAKAGGGTHLLGTDSLGRDVWTRVAYGTRISLGTAALVVFVSAAIG